MRVELDTISRPRATSASRHGAAARATGDRSARGDGKVTAEEKTSDPWTACLTRVKTAQDMEAFARLFAHFAPRAKAFLVKGGADEAQAEDVVQDAMATVWLKAAQFDPARASAATWIFTILRNKQIDRIRKTRRPEPEAIDIAPDAPPDPEEVVATTDEETRLRRAVRALPEAQRLIVEHFYFGDRTHSEIAAVTGLPLGTIKSRIRLGLERLRHELGRR